MSVKIFTPNELLASTDPSDVLFLSPINVVWMTRQILNLIPSERTYHTEDIKNNMGAEMFQWLLRTKDLKKTLQVYATVPIMQLSILNKAFAGDMYKKFVINQSIAVTYNHKDIGIRDSNFRVESNLGLPPSGNAIPYSRTSLHSRLYDRGNDGLRQSQDWETFGFRYNMEGLTHDKPGKYDSATILPYRNPYPVGGMGFVTFHNSPVAYYGNGDTLDEREGSLVKPDKIPKYS